ncbi:LOW QUALITY PROTEIN: LYR motif-containing protein 4-like [Pomacea canaliculata]|uniref:LOW QUALITY PROTEIN: LYR motif-containing protein 4-like n=1 Tax=Pomacea canaliculata TaxID=400727 RepID=UPI000D72C446|nr:LOW QUALITY PROTEIN: LYR motif-containing protein 4-like [Pomacea canaliculata]
MTSARSQVLTLYKNLLREGKKFPDYNYRMYALRKTRDEFQNNKKITDLVHIQELIKEAEENLRVIQRQVVIGQMYSEGKLVIESQKLSGSSKDR